MKTIFYFFLIIFVSSTINSSGSSIYNKFNYSNIKRPFLSSVSATMQHLLPSHNKTEEKCEQEVKVFKYKYNKDEAQKKIFSNFGNIIQSNNAFFLNQQSFTKYLDDRKLKVLLSINGIALTEKYYNMIIKESCKDEFVNEFKKDEVAYLGSWPKIYNHKDLSLWLDCYKKADSMFKAGFPFISNFEYDVLRRKLSVIKYMTRTLIEVPAGSFPEICALDAYTPTELATFFNNVNSQIGDNSAREYLFYPSINGVPVIFFYKNGVFTQAVLKTDNNLIDVSAVVKGIARIPKVLNNSKDIIFYGQLAITTRTFHNLNKKQIEKGLLEWKDTRSALMQSLLYSEEPNKELEMKLKCFIDDVYFPDSTIKENNFNKVSEVFKYIKDLGMPTISTRHMMRGHNYQTAYLVNLLTDFPYESLGIKLMVNDFFENKRLKTLECIYKFSPKLAHRTIKDFTFRVLKNGRIILVIITKLVNCSENSPLKFIVYNEKRIQELNLRKGGKVIVSTFPKMRPELLMASEPETNNGIIKFPEFCPQCRAPNSKKVVNDEVSIWCSVHMVCDPNPIEKIMHFFSVNGFHVPSLTQNILEELMDKSLVYSAEDLFILTKNDFELLDSITKAESNRILSEINLSSKVTLAQFIYALKIPSVTHLMAQEIAHATGSIEKFKKITKKLLIKLEHLDTAAVQGVYLFLQNKNELDKMTGILNSGIIVSESSPKIKELCYKEIGDYTQNDYFEIVNMKQEYQNSYAVTDYEFDLLCNTADRIEAEHQEWKIDRNYIHSKEETIEKIDHINIKKTYLSKELYFFLGQVKPEHIRIEPKVNGVACSLLYKNGTLSHAYTKSTSSYDIYEFIEKLPLIPKRLERNFSGVIRGELYIPQVDVQKINIDRVRSGLKPLIDGLSSIVSVICKCDRNSAINGIIQFFGFYISDDSIGIGEYTLPDCQMIKQLGLNCDIMLPQNKFNSVNDIINFATNVEDRRMDYTTDIDGIVFKWKNSGDLKEKMCAYKFDQEILVSRITGVDFRITNNCLLTAVANIDPLKFSNGRVVSRVYLPTVKDFEELYLNSFISVKYSGGTTPVMQYIKKNQERGKEQKKIEIPVVCPRCDLNLSINKSGLRFCSNIRCGNTMTKSQLVTFAKRMNITYPVISEELINVGLVAKISDYYAMIPEEIKQRTTISYKDIESLFISIDKSKRTTFQNLVYSFNIKGIGDTYVKIVANALKKNKNNIEHINKKMLMKLGLRSIEARYTMEFFTQNLQELKFLLSNIFELIVDNTNNVLPEILSNFTAREHEVQTRLGYLIDSIKEIDKKNDKDITSLLFMDIEKRKYVINMLYESKKTYQKIIPILEKAEKAIGPSRHKPPKSKRTNNHIFL